MSMKQAHRVAVRKKQNDDGDESIKNENHLSVALSTGCHISPRMSSKGATPAHGLTRVTSAAVHEQHKKVNTFVLFCSRSPIRVFALKFHEASDMSIPHFQHHEKNARVSPRFSFHIHTTDS